MIKIRWSREAQGDFATIDDYYHKLNPGYAARVAAQAAKAARFIAENPDAGRRISARTRKWRVGRTPYLLFYRIDGQVLRVVRIIHAARDWQDQIE